ncbi:MAG: glycosyltransferase family 2 protein [Acidobacteriia bacterium]|nr:glycosyltransferase family 2 protein [Terriglobia bacterium]
MTKHICVCICTYRRPDLLPRLLAELDHQDTRGKFTYSIVVVDNDQSRSAENVVSAFARATAVAVRYCVEPRQNIALARNKAVENASGDFIAFIDDDEFPTSRWLLTLFETCTRYDVDGVLGPVKPHFDEEPPTWVLKGRFYDRPTYPTGSVIAWRQGRTGNVLLKLPILTGFTQPFRPEFRTGEDQDFFRRMIERGHRFITCEEAVAFEVVPPIRWKRSFLLRRALLRGASAVVHPTFRYRHLAKSAVAIPLYTSALPFALILGQHSFMSCLVRLCDHIGKVLATLRINPIKMPYITD